MEEQVGIYYKEYDMIVETVESALTGLLRSYIFKEIQYLQRDVKYISWELSRIFSFPITFNFDEETRSFFVNLKYDGFERTFVMKTNV